MQILKSSFFPGCIGMRPEKRGSEDIPKVRLFERAAAAAEAWILVFTKRGFFQDSSALTELYLASRPCCSELNHINLMLMLCALPTCLRRGEGEGLRCWHLTYINYRASDKMRTTIPNGQISMETRLSAFYSIHCISKVIVFEGVAASHFLHISNRSHHVAWQNKQVLVYC